MFVQVVTRFNNLGIGTRLIGAFVFLALVTAGVGAYGLWSLNEVNKALENANENLIPSMTALTDMRGKGINTIQRTERTLIVTDMASVSKEQSTGIEQVNKAVSQMDSVTQRNASQTEEMSATAQTLTDQAGQLWDLVSRFKLSHDAGADARPAAPKAVHKPVKKGGATKPSAAVTKALTNGRADGRFHARLPAHELDSIGGSDGGFTEF